MSPVRGRTPRRIIAGASALLVLIGAVGIAELSLPTSSDASIAGSTELLNMSNQVLNSSSAPCTEGKMCAVYTLNLADAQVFQARVDNPTSGVSVGLYDPLGNEVTSMSVDGSSSDFFNVGIESGPTSVVGVTPVTPPGSYKLMIGSSTPQYFSVYAFVIPDTLTLVGSTSTTAGEFNSNTTRQISGKSSKYFWDGVQFFGEKDSYVTINFDKPGETDAEVLLYDSFRNSLTTGSGSSSASISDYLLPYTGLYQVAIEGDVQGGYTLSVYQPVAVMSVGLSVASSKLKIGGHETTALTFVPATATNRNVSYQSSNPSVARVSATGTITGVKKGSAVISVITQDGERTASVAVHVKGYAVSKVHLVAKTTKVKVHKKLHLSRTFSPSKASNKKVTWTSSNPRVAKVSSKGVVTGLKAGRTKITVTSKDGHKKSSKTIVVTKR